VAQALHAYVEPELLNGGNQYECSTCQCRRDSHRRVVLKTLPPVLTFSCQRFDIDRTTWQRVKVTSEFRFPLTFSMRPFTEAGVRCPEDSKKFMWVDDSLEAAQRVAARLVATYGADTKAIVNEQLQDRSSFLYQSLKQEIAAADGPMNDVDNDIYQLFAVIMHHGSAYSGHYSAYIRDVMQEGEWMPPTSDASSDNTMSGKEKKGEGETDNETALPSNLCYMLQRSMSCAGGGDDAGRDGDLYLILENSPLHIVLSIISSSSSTSSMSMADLRALLEPNLGGKKWNAVYQSQYGTLPSFIKHHSTLFDYNAPLHNNSKQEGRISVQRDVRYNVVPLTAFKAAAAAYAEDELLAFFCPTTTGTATSSSSIVQHGVSAPDTEQSSEWQTGKRKNKKKSNKSSGNASPRSHDQTKKLSEANDHKQATCESVDTEASDETSAATSLQEEEIVHLLLTTFHGAFFNFNDSSVTSISLRELKNAFEGSSSAYILVYRNSSLDGQSPVKQVTTPCPCPPFWQAKVDVLNEELRVARRDYETYMQTINLTVWFPAHFSSYWPVLRRRDEHDELMLGGFLPSAGVSLTFDNRKSVVDLRNAVIAEVQKLISDFSGSTDLGDMATPLLMQALHLPNNSELADLQLSPLQLCSTSSGGNLSGGINMYASSPLDGTAKVGDALSDFADVLVWKQEKQISAKRSSDDVSGRCEVYTHPPKHVIISYATHQTTSIGTASLCAQPLWYPISKTVGELCSYVLEQILFVSLSHPTLRVDYLKQVQDENAAYGKTSCWVTRCLIKNGRWQKLSGQAKGKTWDTANFEDFEGVEICFDLGDEKQSLAEEEASRRNRQWTIQVKYEDEKRTGKNLASIAKDLKAEYLLSLEGTIETNGDVDKVEKENDEDLLSQSSFAHKTTLHVEMDCDQDVVNLKLRILSLLLNLNPSDSVPTTFSPALLRRVQFRTGHNLGVNMLENEDYSLKECGLYHEATLRLQIADSTGDEATSSSGDGVCIRFCLVSGNDQGSTEAIRMGKHNPKQPGTRSLILSLNLDDPEETLANMKQRALTQYFKVLDEKNEAESVVPSSEGPKRMRKTNWADECTDELLFEVARSSTKGKNGGDAVASSLVAVTVGSALSNGNLKDNDLLLFEDGELPDRDTLLLEVFLWPSSLSAAAQHPPSPVSIEPLDFSKASTMREEFETMLMGGGDKGCGVHPDMQAKLDWLPRVGKVACSRHGTLTDLYEACFKALTGFHEQEREANNNAVKDDSDTFPFICEFLFLIISCVVLTLNICCYASAALAGLFASTRFASIVLSSWENAPPSSPTWRVFREYRVGKLHVYDWKRGCSEKKEEWKHAS